MADKRKALPKPRRKEEPPSRAVCGRKREGVSFPAPPLRMGMPAGYAATLNEIKEQIRTERLRVVLSANAAMVMMYWGIGRTILIRQEAEGWGAKVIDRLSCDLREEFPDMRGLSPRNLLFMRSFAAAYPDAEIVKQLVSLLPWGHVIHLLQRVKDHDARNWYASASIANGALGCGKSVVENLAKDLQTGFPGRNGFSAQNRWFMRQFFLEYQGSHNLQPLARETSWAKNLVIGHSPMASSCSRTGEG